MLIVMKANIFYFAFFMQKMRWSANIKFLNKKVLVFSFPLKGGTLDITAHELQEDHKLCELYHANGGHFGGTQVDDNFIQLLKDIFGEEVLSQYRSENPADWLQMMINFERRKRGFNPKDRSQSLNIALSYEFVDSYQTLTGKNIKTLKQTGISFASGMLRLSCDIMDKLFNPVVSGIVDHVKDLLQKPVLREVSHVLLVGGFGESLVLQEALRGALNDKTELLVPSEASLCVLKGATLFGHLPGTIAKRVARKTYGKDVNQVYDPNIHPDPYKIVEHDGVSYAHPLFYKFITKGDLVNTGQKCVFTTSPSTATQQSMETNIFQTDKPDPVYTDEEGVDMVGSIHIDLPGHGLDREVEYLISFGGTELEVEVQDPRPGGERKTCTVDLLSH